MIKKKSTYKSNFIDFYALLISSAVLIYGCDQSAKESTNEVTSSIAEKKVVKPEDIRRAGTSKGNRFFEDNSGNKLFNGAVFYNAFEFSGNYCVVSKMINGKELHGVINSEGKLVIDYAYDVIESDYLRTHYFKVANKDSQKYLYGLTDSLGKLIIPITYSDLGTVNNGILKAQQKYPKWGIINLKNETILPFEYDFIGSWQNGLARVSKDKNYKSNYGYIDQTGKVVIECQYPVATNFEKGIALVQKGKKIGFINSKNETVIDFQFDDYKDIVDVSKNEMSKTGYSESNKRFIMEEGYIVLSKNAKWGYIDTTGKEIIPFEYNFVGLPDAIGNVNIDKDGKSGRFDLKTKKISW